MPRHKKNAIHASTRPEITEDIADKVEEAELWLADTLKEAELYR